MTLHSSSGSTFAASSKESRQKPVVGGAAGLIDRLTERTPQQDDTTGLVAVVQVTEVVVLRLGAVIAAPELIVGAILSMTPHNDRIYGPGESGIVGRELPLRPGEPLCTRQSR